MFKRVALFLATNIAVMVLLSVVMFILQSVFGIRLGNNGALLLMAGLFGFGGALISLALSKWTAKRMTGMALLDPANPGGETQRWLVDLVRRQATTAGIGMPEVGIYDAPEINAFATGANRNNALVAVSTGLLRAMNRDEAEAVIGHEITHVANGDMVTLTLIQGVVNTFVIYLSRVVGRVIDTAISGGRSDSGPGIAYFLIVLMLQVVFGLLASIIVMAFSRWREFRADAGGARLAGRGKMIAALEKLGMAHGESTLPKAIAAFGISGSIAHGLQGLFRSHPPLEQRIQRLRDAGTVA
ncbi:protease HtpX [soil metagenome]